MFILPILGGQNIDLCCLVILFRQVKTGPFAEHSNQLWNISAVPNWDKVNSGLIKMYKAEVRTFLHKIVESLEASNGLVVMVSGS